MVKQLKPSGLEAGTSSVTTSSVTTSSPSMGRRIRALVPVVLVIATSGAFIVGRTRSAWPSEGTLFWVGVAVLVPFLILRFAIRDPRARR
jgi:hypothetical protein